MTRPTFRVMQKVDLRRIVPIVSIVVNPRSEGSLVIGIRAKSSPVEHDLNAIALRLRSDIARQDRFRCRYFPSEMTYVNDGMNSAIDFFSALFLFLQ
jgi:hypothetical protein